MKHTFKTALVAALLVSTPATHAAFSGERELEISVASLSTFPTFTVPDLVSLGDSARYVGSTPDWHIFAEKLTSDEGGMPFDSVYGYKVPITAIRLEGGHAIDLTDQGFYAFVQECSTFKVTGSEGAMTNLTVHPGECLFPKTAD